MLRTFSLQKQETLIKLNKEIYSKKNLSKSVIKRFEPDKKQVTEEIKV